jgi:hypothetical protein
VAQSSFSGPCQPLAGGVWSGFVLTTSSESVTTTSQAVGGYKRQVSMPSFTITVNNTNPAFFYCAQISHCQSGMVFALNPNVQGWYFQRLTSKANQTLAEYISAASKASTTIPTEAPQGGILSTSSSGSPTSSPSPTAKSGGAIASWNVWVLLLGCAGAGFFTFGLANNLNSHGDHFIQYTFFL